MHLESTLVSWPHPAIVRRPLLALAVALASGASPAAAQVTTSTAILTASVAESLDAVRLHPDDPIADHSGTPLLPPRTSTLSLSAGPLTDARALPDYDGRDDGAAASGDVLIWVPRVLFFPVYAVMEYGVRWPLVSFITWQEKTKILARLTGAVTFREGRSGLFPTAFFDFGLLPSVGFFFFNEDLFLEGHSFQVQGGFWADDWRRVVLRDQMRIFADTGHVDLRLEYATRPDHIYYGQGWATHQSSRVFFTHRILDAELGLSAFLKGLNRVSAFVRYRNGELGSSLACAVGGANPTLEQIVDCNGRSPSIETRFDTTKLAGFGGDGYQLITTGVGIELDTRQTDREFTDGTGLRAELASSFSVDPTDPTLNFMRWNLQGNAFLDITGKNHVIGLQLYTGFLHRTGDREVPITEQVIGGGEEVLRGFLPGRFRGDTMFAATIDYRYPIWALIDANFFLGVGNAFGPFFEGFAWKRLVMSGGFALRTSLSRETSLDLVIGFGTNRFEESTFQVDSVRFSFGANHGF